MIKSPSHVPSTVSLRDKGTGLYQEEILKLYSTILRKGFLGLPWWCSGQESACQCRGHRFEPWSGKIPHAVEQLSPCATTTEPAL